MLELLERRQAAPDVDPAWVFPGDGKTGHMVEVKSGWARILKRAGITDCRMHDHRRTLGSWQALQGASLAIIGASLGHQSLQATQVYARLNADPVRASVTRATDAMLAAARLPKGLLPALPVKPKSNRRG
jgi:integrase